MRNLKLSTYIVYAISAEFHSNINLENLIGKFYIFSTRHKKFGEMLCIRRFHSVSHTRRPIHHLYVLLFVTECIVSVYNFTYPFKILFLFACSKQFTIIQTFFVFPYIFLVEEKKKMKNEVMR